MSSLNLSSAENPWCSVPVIHNEAKIKVNFGSIQKPGRGEYKLMQQTTTRNHLLETLSLFVIDTRLLHHAVQPMCANVRVHAYAKCTFLVFIRISRTITKIVTCEPVQGLNLRLKDRRNSYKFCVLELIFEPFDFTPPGGPNADIPSKTDPFGLSCSCLIPCLSPLLFLQVQATEHSIIRLRISVPNTAIPSDVPVPCTRRYS